MFYESKNYLTADELKFESGTNFSFPMHLHNSFELITVTDGEMNVAVEGKTYTLTSGKAVLVFPNQVHEVITEQGKTSRHFLWIFSPKLVQAYNKIFLSKIPESNLFSISERDLASLGELVYTEESPSVMRIKGVLYSICAEFDATTSYIERKNDSEELLSKIFNFVETNYNKDCSLCALSADTSYHYVYLSKYFKQCTGISFTDYVNRYRVNESCYIIKNSKQSILQTAYDSGFDSLRSFNRNFKNVMGITPSEYKNGSEKAY